MTPGNLVERTALSGFTFRGLPVVKGQIVNLDPDQLASLAGAGCVALTAEANARVPVSDLPALQASPATEEARQINARLDEMRTAARDEATRLERSIADARSKAADDIAEIERGTADRLQAIGRQVTEAEAKRDADLKAIADAVEAARAAADQAIAAETARGDAAKSKSGKPAA